MGNNPVFPLGSSIGMPVNLCACPLELETCMERDSMSGTYIKIRSHGKTQNVL